MKCIFYLSGDHVDLAREEVISLFGIGNYKLNGRLVIADLNDNEKALSKTFSRLALTKSIYRQLFECKIDELIDFMKGFDWNSVYKKDFCLRVERLGNKAESNEKNFTEKTLSGYIWDNAKNPKVNLKNPKTLIQLFIVGHNAYCGLLIYTNNEDFESRKSHR